MNEFAKEPTENKSDQSLSHDLGLENVFTIEDLAHIWKAHQDPQLNEKGRTRRFDSNVPYAVHPIWCKISILTEPNLPAEIRYRGSKVLGNHDIVEDTKTSLPAWTEPEVGAAVKEMTCPGGSAQERTEIWTKTPEIRLYRLYDKVSNFLDGSWMDEQRRETQIAYIRALNQDVKQNYPGLNISKIADALVTEPQVYWPEVDPEATVRLSVANLVPVLKVADREFYIGILNRKHYERGTMVYGALGGAAEMEPQAQAMLHSLYGADFKEGTDARFTIKGKHLAATVAQFENWPSPLCEATPERELEEELCGKELPGLGAILETEDLKGVRLSHLKTGRQEVNPGGLGSVRETAETPSRRVFNLFQMEVTPAVFSKIAQHDAVRLFSKKELADLGKDRVCADGAKVLDNLFPL